MNLWFIFHSKNVWNKLFPVFNPWLTECLIQSPNLLSSHYVSGSPGIPLFLVSHFVNQFVWVEGKHMGFCSYLFDLDFPTTLEFFNLGKGDPLFYQFF